MEIIKAKVPEDCQIFIAGDFHYGGLNTSHSSLKQFISDVQSEDNNYMVCLGDAIEAILPSDKRWATCSVDWQNRILTPEDQMQAIVGDFKPIADRVLCWLMRNH